MAVGQVVVRAAMLEGLLLELCVAVKIDPNLSSPAALEARRKWAMTPGTKLIDLMLQSLDRIPEGDRDQFKDDMDFAHEALRERHVAAHTTWPFGMTEEGMLGIRSSKTGRAGSPVDVIIKTLDDFGADAENLRIAEETVVRLLEHLGAWYDQVPVREARSDRAERDSSAVASPVITTS